jgi:dienelactone hydrolase
MTARDHRLHPRCSRFMLFLFAFLALGARAAEGPPRALPAGQVPHDRRLGELRDLDGYFPFQPCATPDEWARRAERVRRELAVALGLWPMPPKTSLNAVIHGKIDRGDYTIENVYFESVPGFFVTGNLYRPKGKPGKRPGILTPHGHWRNGRFTDNSPEEVRQAIARGEERFTEGGRSPLQARCVQLARMGCVVFHYDMIGYADSVQIPERLAHGFSRQRPEMNAPQDWGLFSPQAEAHLQSVMGLQTWSSIRALDFLASLPDVDAKRLGVTGASGGGTQTFILCALDPRPAVAFPAVMVSTAMQGGCTCENASLLRVDTGNVEIAAMFAPKPLGMTAANDWTKEMPTKGFPELQRHFALLGAAQNVQLTPLLQFGHNYNYVSRAAMYEWFNRKLKLGAAEPVIEKDYTFSTPQELSVWDDRHPKPPGGPDFERQLLRWITQRDEGLLGEAQRAAREFRKVYGGAFDAILGRRLSDTGPVSFSVSHEFDRGSYVERVGLLRNSRHDEELPTLILQPKRPRRRVVIWLDSEGKSGLYARSNSGVPRLKAGVLELLQAGVAVMGVDLLYQGEFLADGQPLTQARKVKNPREAAAYTFGYNYALFAQRVQDVLSAIQYARANLPGGAHLDLLGLSGAGAWAAAAKAQAGNSVNRLAVDTAGLRFARLTDWQDVNFLPGAAKYGDLPGLLALGAPGKLWLAGEGVEAPPLTERIYREAHAGKRMTISHATPQEEEAEAVHWLLSDN